MPKTRFWSDCRQTGSNLPSPSMRRPIHVKSFFDSLLEIFSFSFSQAASVATLPSALLVERSSLGASWVFSIQQVLLSDKRPRLLSLREKFGPGLVRSHLNSAVKLGCL